MKNEQIKHLEFIQNIITRMNQNSFQIKGWTITIVSALLALYANSFKVVYVFIAIIPTILFWFLDTYYLQQERKFRGVYKDVIKNDDSIGLFEMPIQNYVDKNYSFSKVLLSKTIICFYSSILILLIIGILITKFNIL